MVKHSLFLQLIRTERKMILTIADILSACELETFRAECDQLTWRDGSNTAGVVARSVKRNLQADLSKGRGLRVRRALEDAIFQNPLLQSSARPARFSPPILSRSDAGGGYGTHVDNAFMGAGPARLRTDLSYTLFLSDPDHYAGGELVIDLPGSTQSYKLNAGDLLLYPSTYLHGVTEVGSGSRLACVGWIESHVPAPEDREILFDLENLKAALADQYGAAAPERLIAMKLMSNLLRRFSR